MKKFYEILAVHRDASDEEIKKSYRRLSKKYHPDINQGNKDAEIKFKELSEAYTVLKNAQSRKEYDDKLDSFTGDKKKQTKTEPKQQRQSSSTGEFDIGNINMQFGQFFGFDPQNKEKNMNISGKGKGKNPLDTSHLFESFFTAKKK